MIQVHAMDEKIDYPAYLNSPNMTKLEQDYAEVRETKKLPVIDHLHTVVRNVVQL